MRNVILMMFIAIVSRSTTAGQFAFDCAVKNVYRLNDKAQIVRNDKATSSMLDERFSVDRRTGGIVGKVIPAFPVAKSSVLFPGGKGNSFKSYFQDGNFVGYIEVFEYETGKLKPFVMHDGRSIVSGFCE